jgi:hypothetical protein
LTEAGKSRVLDWPGLPRTLKKKERKKEEKRKESKKRKRKPGYLWFMPGILINWKTEIGRIMA